MLTRQCPVTKSAQATNQTNGLIQFNSGQLQISVRKWNNPLRNSPQGVTLLAFSLCYCPHCSVAPIIHECFHWSLNTITFSSHISCGMTSLHRHLVSLAAGSVLLS